MCTERAEALVLCERREVGGIARATAASSSKTNGTLVVVSQTSPPESGRPLLERLLPSGHPARQLRRPVRGTDPRHDRIGDPGPVRGRQPARGGLARRRHAEHRRPPAGCRRRGPGDLVLADGRRAMQYGSGQGEPAMREAICEVMRLEGIGAHPDDVVVTVGSQQGLDLVTRIFCDPGDVVICEAP